MAVVLALRALGLGDLLAAVPALRALAEAFPSHRHVLAAPTGLAPVARWVGWDLVDTAPLAPLDAALHGADLAVNLHGRGPQSTALLRASGPRRLLTYGDGHAWDDAEHERVRWCRLLCESGIPADPARVDLTVPGPPAEPGATLVHPGGARPAVRWPAQRFAAVAAAEHRAGRRVLVTGSASEVDLATAVAEGAGLPPDAVLAGRTDLDTLARLVRDAGRVVSADTGIAHLAVALGTPSVTIFGPVPPALWGPPPDRPQHRVLWTGRPADPAEISVDRVLAALD